MSEILFLGTGAADWIIADRNGFFRRFSSALINGELLLDCGEHFFDYPKTENAPHIHDKITDVLITHRHRDHFCVEAVIELAEKQKLRIACNDDIKNTIGEHKNIQFIPLVPYKPQTVGRYTVIPLLANHDVVTDGDMRAYHYIIKTPDNKTVFYGLDGAWFLRPSWEEMKRHTFDVMVFDCTVGDFDDWRLFEHNTIPMLRKMIPQIKEKNMIKEGGLLIASHLARSLHGTHEQTQSILDELSMICAYDTMKKTF